MLSRRGYNDVYAMWGCTFPNSLQPTAGARPLTWDQFGAQLEAEGVNLLRVKFTGRNGPLGQSSVLSFEPTIGSYNTWGGELDAFLTMCRQYNVGILALPFENEEWRKDDAWTQHAWNRRNGGPLADRADVLISTGAMDAAKRRLDTIAQVAGDVICGWGMAEFTQLFTAEFFGVPFSELERIVLLQGVPWMAEITDHIHSIHDAPVGCGIVDKIGQAREFVNEICRVPGLDWAALNWYGAQDVGKKLPALRQAQAYTGLPCHPTQYAPWSIGGLASYQRDDDPFPRSKAHEWAAKCGGGVAMRWPEASANSVERPWWGVAHPNLATIGGVTREFDSYADLESWAGAGREWDAQIAGAVDYVSTWSDGAHLTAFVAWDRSNDTDLHISGLPDGDYLARWFDWLDGVYISQQPAQSSSGTLALPDAPDRADRSVLYLERQDVTPPQPTRIKLRLTVPDGTQTEAVIEAGQTYTIDILEP